MKSLKEVHNTLNAHVPWYRQHPHRVLAGVLAAIAILVGLCLMPSGSSHSGLTAEEQAQRDSAALHVALMPVHDCFPAFYAQRMGIYDRLGLDLRILTLQAQLDTDTALTRGRAELIYSDLARAIFMQQDTTPLRAVAATEGTLQLITARRGRVRQLNQLKERMVAVARHSITDYWSDRLTDTARMARADIFRPQINNVRIRTDMLCNGTMDAAFLPSPFAEEALLWSALRREVSQAESTREAVDLIRRKKGLSWEKLALEVGVSRPTLMGWLENPHIRLQQVTALCVALRLRGDVGRELVRVTECSVRTVPQKELYLSMVEMAQCLTVERCGAILQANGLPPLHCGDALAG